MSKTTNLIIEKINLSTLRPHPENPRKHPDKDSLEWNNLKASLEHDYFDPIVFNKTNNYLVSGHLRVKILTDLGYESADCVIVNYDEDTHLMRMISANKLIGTDNRDSLNIILQKYKNSDLIKICGYSEEEIKRIKTLVATQNNFNDKRYNFDDTESKKINEKYNIKVGDVITLGRHRIVCGDSTEQATYNKLFLKDEKFHLLFTDPPYGISLSGVTNDDADIFDKIIAKAFEQMNKYMEIGSSFYIFFADENVDKVMNLVRKLGWKIQAPFLIWMKENRGSLTRLDYSPKSESFMYGQKDPDKIIHPLNAYDKDEDGKLLYGWKLGASHHYVEDRKNTNLFYYDKVVKALGHPTAKPIELCAKAIGNSTYADEIVFDPFGGSLSTLFACEEIERICRIVELEPHYVAYALENWKIKYPDNPDKKIIINGVEFNG